MSAADPRGERGRFVPRSERLSDEERALLLAIADELGLPEASRRTGQPVSSIRAERAKASRRGEFLLRLRPSEAEQLGVALAVYARWLRDRRRGDEIEAVGVLARRIANGARATRSGR